MEKLPTIKKIMAVAGAPGMSFAVIHRNETVCIHHLGFRSVEHGLKPDDNTRYNINSLTKAIVAQLVGILIHERDDLDWHQLVKTHLPEFTSVSAEIAEHCTILDLLSHRMAVTGLDDLWMGASNVVYLDKSEALRTFATLKPTGTFRASFMYNNWGYEIIAQILEKVTGEELSDLLQKKIFDPLKMTRSSTSWDSPDKNSARSYNILKDMKPVKIHRPSLGKGTIMEAAGGVKSTLPDLIKFYKTFMKTINSQFKSGEDSTVDSILKNSRMLASGHVNLPGLSFREQTYGAGWARCQLPGQLGRLSTNVGISDEPVAGTGGQPAVVVYHHGCMPGSTSVVNLIPETESAVIILQNSMPPIDTADLVGQLLVELIVGATKPNDYVKLAEEFTAKAVRHVDDINEVLMRSRRPGTMHKDLSHYSGVYFNEAQNFQIVICEANGELQMSIQGDDTQAYRLEHYHDDTFSWLMPFDEIAKRGRSTTFYEPEYYLIEFRGDGKGIHELLWAADDNFPGEKLKFTCRPPRARVPVSIWPAWLGFVH